MPRSLPPECLHRRVDRGRRQTDALGMQCLHRLKALGHARDLDIGILAEHFHDFPRVLYHPFRVKRDRLDMQVSIIADKFSDLCQHIVGLAASCRKDRRIGRDAVDRIIVVDALDFFDVCVVD